MKSINEQFDEKFVKHLADKRPHLVSPDMDGLAIKSFYSQAIKKMVDEMVGEEKELNFKGVDLSETFKLGKQDGYNQKRQELKEIAKKYI